jgi:hypothetical protein
MSLVFKLAASSDLAVYRARNLNHFILCNVMCRSRPKKSSAALVQERSIPTKQPPLVDKVSADRQCCMGSATDPHIRILGFPAQSHYYRVRQASFLFSYCTKKNSSKDIFSIFFITKGTHLKLWFTILRGVGCILLRYNNR